MRKITGREKSLTDLLANKKYTIHYYQREYRWGTKQILELISDLTEEFNEYYQPSHTRRDVADYGYYYMGSIIITGSDEGNAIIDGQQRLTSITLLLIYLNNLQKEKGDVVDFNNLIYSEQYGEKSFNLKVTEREKCLNALFSNNTYDTSNEIESVKNIVSRYNDIKENFNQEITNGQLPYFIDWLINKVYFVEINANTDQDAHKVFVTMNDRGLSLTPTEMLKGYLLSEISNDAIRNTANELWKKKIQDLNNSSDDNKESDDEFIKNWLRAQYAETIRETKKGAVPEDFDLIGTEFHKWVHENYSKIGLTSPVSYEKFILDEFNIYADLYMKLKKYSKIFNEDYKYVYYNANRNFTLQNQLILASIDKDDSIDIIDRKIKIVSCFIDQYITRRVVNFKVVDYSTIKNAVFNLTKKFRRLSIDELKRVTKQELSNMGFELNNINKFYLNGFTVRYMLHILARITNYVEEKSQIPNSSFVKYTDRTIKNSYDIEHILANNFSKYSNLFIDENDFESQRNKLGALLLLPKDKNRSYQDKPYSEKVILYFGENLLAKSLHPDCYRHNPHFLTFNINNNIGFKDYKIFDKNAIAERQSMYLRVAKMIWDPNIIDSI